MKKEQKRYMLVEYQGIEERTYDTYKEYEELLETIKKHNKKQGKKYIFGNVSVEKINGLYKATIHKYHPLTKKMKISEIDELTSSMDEKGLIEHFKVDILTNEGYIPDINIAYFESKNYPERMNDKKKGRAYASRIKYIPVMYQEDLRYLDPEFIEKVIIYYAKNIDVGFFKALCSEFSVHKIVAEECEYLLKLANDVEIDKVHGHVYSSDINALINYSLKIYRNLILERDKGSAILRDENGKPVQSRRRVRDFSFFIKNYDQPKDKRISPLKYNKGPDYSLMKKRNYERIKFNETYTIEEDGQMKLKLN